MSSPASASEMVPGPHIIVCNGSGRPRARLEPTARRPARPFLALASGGYLLAVIAIWLAMRQIGDRMWPGTLLLIAPRWTYTTPLLVLWPWALAARRWRPIVTSCAATGVALFAVMGFHVSWPGGAERGDLRLMTCNIHRQHLDASRMAEFIAKVEPDVVALQGWSDIHQGALFTDGKWEVRKEGELLVASRYPIRSVTPLVLEDDPGTLPGERGAAAMFEIQSSRGPVNLIGLHLASPHAGLNSVWSDRGRDLSANLDRRWRESRRLRDVADRTQGPLLLAGDFNTVGESPIFREHWADFADAFVERGSGFGYTYLINHTQIRIDHVLADPSWQVVRCWVGPDVSAAHRPLVADLKLR